MVPNHHQHTTGSADDELSAAKSATRLPRPFYNNAQAPKKGINGWYADGMPWSAINWEIAQWEHYFSDAHGYGLNSIAIGLQWARWCEKAFPHQSNHTHMVRRLEMAHAAMRAQREQCEEMARPAQELLRKYKYPASFREKILSADEEDLDYSGCYFPRKDYEELVMDRYGTLEKYEQRHDECSDQVCKMNERRGVCSRVRARAMQGK